MIIWDPVNKIMGAATIVMDLSVVGVDLVAQPESMIVTRTEEMTLLFSIKRVDTMRYRR